MTWSIVAGALSIVPRQLQPGIGDFALDPEFVLSEDALSQVFFEMANPEMQDELPASLKGAYKDLLPVEIVTLRAAMSLLTL